MIISAVDSPVMETLSGIGAQVPALTVLVIVVWVFLRHLERIYDMFKQLHNEHLQARKESLEALKENTRSNNDLAECIHDLNEKRA